MASNVNDEFSTLSPDNSQEISPPSPPYITYLKFTKITLETPVQDYHYNMGVQLETDDDPDASGFKQILAETREVLWQLLFGETELTEENSNKAAILLGEYRHDACYYNPWDYNDWILKVKDELLRRKYLDFWEKLVKYEYGLITTRDSTYFDDFEDPRASDFYNIVITIAQTCLSMRT